MRASSIIALVSLLSAACGPVSPVGERASPVTEGTPASPAPEADLEAPSPATPDLETPGPDATEPPPESGLPLPGACDAPWGYTFVELIALLGDPEAWDGQPIATLGPVFPGVICTAMECPPVPACCEPCHVTHTMNGPPGSGNRVDDHVAIDVTQPECAATCECAKRGGPAGDAIVWGTFRLQGDSTAIEMDGFCEHGEP